MIRIAFRTRSLNPVEVYFRGDDASVTKTYLGSSQTSMIKLF